MQVPWCKRFHGLVVVINLWSGFGCALYALLAAGNRVIPLTTEQTFRRWDALSCEFPAAVHLKPVEDVHAEMLQPWLRQRSVSVILEGGKISCHTSMSEQPHHLSRLVHSITNLPEVRFAFTQVVGWLKTASSVPDEVKCNCDELLSAQHFEIAASDLGWICQNHTCWVSFLTNSLKNGIDRLVQLWPDFFSQFSPSIHKAETNSDGCSH